MFAYGDDEKVVILNLELSIGIIIDSPSLDRGTIVELCCLIEDDNGNWVFEYSRVVNPENGYALR